MNELFEAAIKHAQEGHGAIEEVEAYLARSSDSEYFFGVERVETCGKGCSYVNMGDTYSVTVIKPDDGVLTVGSWGDWVEEVEADYCKEHLVYKCPNCGEFHSKGLAPGGSDGTGDYCPQKHSPARHCDEFTKEYIECALWSTHDPLDISDWPMTLANAGWGVDDIRYELHVSMVEDCTQFQHDNAELLKQAGTSYLNGHDFWLTREGHGTGFWDRGYGEVGDKLTEAAKAWGSGSDEFYQYDWSTN